MKTCIPRLLVAVIPLILLCGIVTVVQLRSSRQATRPTGLINSEIEKDRKDP